MNKWFFGPIGRSFKLHPRREQTYVANRVGEIRDLTSPQQWRHCPGKLNPADDVNRGLGTNEFLKNERWLKGSPFLYSSEDHWPEPKFENIAEEKLEIKKEVYVTTVNPTASLNCLLIQFSNWIALLCTFAWLLKFLQWIKWSSRKKKEETNTCEITRHISHEEIEKSKGEIVKLVQKSVFPQEIKDLKAGRQVKASSHFVKLKPAIMNDGVLRISGRISRAPISPDAMSPMILPKNHQVTTILYAIYTRGGAAVREITGRCISCKK